MVVGGGEEQDRKQGQGFLRGFLRFVPSYDRALRDGSPRDPWTYPSIGQFMLSRARVPRYKSWICCFLAW